MKTVVSIDESSGSVEIERATISYWDVDHVKLRPGGEKGWIAAQLVLGQLGELMSLSLQELQQLHIKQMEI